MIAFVLRRLLQAVVVMLVVALIAFLMFKFVGDPVAQMVGQETTIAERDALRERLGLNDPFVVQFVRYVADVAQADFGLSFRTGRPVDTMLAERLPATLELALVAAIYALMVGIPMGVYTGLYPNTALSRLFQAISLAGISLPTFFVGILLILLFGVVLGWLPTFGRGETVQLGWWSSGLFTVSGLKSLILPAFTLGMFQLTLIMRLVRSEMLEVLRTDYIKFARARGLTNRSVHIRACPEEHACAGHYNHRPPVRFDHRLCDYHRGRLPVAGHGTALSAGDSIRRYPGNVDLSDSHLVLLRRHQPNRRPALLRRRSAAPHRQNRDFWCGRMTDVVDRPSSPAATRESVLHRLFDSDIWYSFTRSRVTMIAAAITALFFVAALFAPLIAPADPYDLAGLSLLDAFTPPVWSDGGSRLHLLGTDEQGRDMLSAIIFGARVSLTVGFASIFFSMVLGITLGLVAGYTGGMVDAFIMRVADVQLSFPAILIALLIDGVVRGVLPPSMHNDVAIWVLIFSIGISNWVQFARTVRGSCMVERNKEYVQGRPHHRHPSRPHYASTRAAKCDGAGSGDRHHRLGYCRVAGGNAQFPRRRHAANAPQSWHPRQFGTELPRLG